MLGFFNVINAAKENNVKKFFYASSSSVYGLNQKTPFKENFKLNFASNIYVATKQSNEMIAKTYEFLHGYQSIGLRFFSVYGPWGRPDMAVYNFTKNILEKKKIKVFNNGQYRRDFTYIDDVTESIRRLIKLRISLANSILNIGGSKSYKVLNLIKIIEKNLKLRAKIIERRTSGEMKVTMANSKKLEKLIKFRPTTTLKTGVSKFIKWYLGFKS